MFRQLGAAGNENGFGRQPKEECPENVTGQ